jgi:drug/metabolite transporter (DMT)-like permease
MIIDSQLDRHAIAARRVSPALPVLAVVAVAVTWGVTFSVVDDAAQRMPPADLVAWRFVLATTALLLVRHRGRRMSAGLRLRGIVMGALLGLGFLLQTWAMTDTDAMMAGFLIGTMVVIAPAVGWALFRVRPALSTWIGVAVATSGLALLSLRGGGFGRGEALTLLAAAVWALHLVLLARWGRPAHALELARTQTATVAVMALVTVAVGGAVSGGRLLPEVPPDGGSLAGIVFLALPATAVAMLALSWAQPRMSAARAAVILTLEPAAAALTAAVLGAEIGARTVLGGALLVLAMLIVEWGSTGRAGRWWAIIRRSTVGRSWAEMSGRGAQGKIEE